MKHYLRIPVILILMVFAIGAKSQEVWSLQKCIDYALENNIEIKQKALNSDYYGNKLNQAKSDRLPNLNAYLSNDMSYGRSLSYDNTYKNVNSNSSSATVSSSITLWNGSVLRNTVKKAGFDLQSKLQDLQKAKDDITLNIAAAYLDILLADELVAVDADQTAITKMQIDRTSKLVDAGSLARGSLLEIEAQLAREELELVNQQNSLQLAYLNLYQLLELPSAESFKIVKPNFPMLNAAETMLNSMDIFKTAVDIRPEIKSAEYQLQSAEKDLSIAKGNQYPDLTFGLNYYNAYNNKYTNTNGSTINLSDQLSNNKRYGFGFDLTIPIFNRREVKNGISNAMIQKNNLELELQSAKNLLRKDIEQAYANALAAMKSYMANQKAVDSMTESFRYTEEKFNVGMVNSVEYNESKNNLAKAKSDLLQAKYEYIFRTKILDFYAGKAIEL